MTEEMLYTLEFNLAFWFSSFFCAIGLWNYLEGKIDLSSTCDFSISPNVRLMVMDC